MIDEKSLIRNPVVPNTNAYWCYRCKAQNGFDHLILSGPGSYDEYDKMSCVRGQASTFKPAETRPRMLGLLGFAVGAPVLEFCVSHAIMESGMLWAAVGFAAFAGLIGFMMLYHMRHWLSWSRRQGTKSAEQLEWEGREYITLIEKERK